MNSTQTKFLSLKTESILLNESNLQNDFNSLNYGRNNNENDKLIRVLIIQRSHLNMKTNQLRLNESSFSL